MSTQRAAGDGFWMIGEDKNGAPVLAATVV